MLGHISNRQARKFGENLGRAIAEALPPLPPQEITRANTCIMWASLPGTTIRTTYTPRKYRFYQRRKKAQQLRGRESCRIVGYIVRERVAQLPDIDLEAFDERTGSFTLKNRNP